MQARTAIAHMRALPLQSFSEAFGDRPILILAPHPDDESLGCGGLIAEACRVGWPPVVAILTDGSRSHPNSRAYPAERLRALREQETQEAMAELGLPPERLAFLGYADTRAPHRGEALVNAAKRVCALVDAWGCSIIATSWRHDPHCDHAAAAAIGAAASKVTGATPTSLSRVGMDAASRYGDRRHPSQRLPSRYS